MVSMRFALCLATLALTGCNIDAGSFGEKVHEDFHYSYEMKPGARLTLDSFNGNVEIDAWDQNKIDISGTKFAPSKEALNLLKIEAHDGGDRVDVRAVRPSEMHGNAGARFTIHVPRSVELDRIGTSNGSVKVNGTAGDARVRTSNGSIKMDRVSGGMTLQTSNGSIEVEMVTAPKSDIRAKTSNGPIKVYLPTSSAARVRASTSNSSITNDFGLAAEGKRHLEGAIGSGGPSIELATSNGSIKIGKSN